MRAGPSCCCRTRLLPSGSQIDSAPSPGSSSSVTACTRSVLSCPASDAELACVQNRAGKVPRQAVSAGYAKAEAAEAQLLCATFCSPACRRQCPHQAS